MAIDPDTELIEYSNFTHRALYDIDKNILTPKQSFTIDDLVNYLFFKAYLMVYPNKATKISSLHKSTLTLLQKEAIAQVSNSPCVIMNGKSIVYCLLATTKKYSLDQTLTGIDELSSNDLTIDGVLRNFLLMDWERFVGQLDNKKTYLTQNTTTT